MNAVVILPTYNEKENIPIVIKRLESAFLKVNPHTMQILVVDDSSPDNTAGEVKKLQKEYKNLSMISGQKQGLGVAYLRGFDYAINEMKAEIVVMMDADLSHPPELLPQLLKGIDEGYDVIIGSRYIEGGGTPEWGLGRKIISKTGNFFSRFIIGINASDCTSGYRAIRVSKFNIIDKNINTKGYAFLSTLLFELVNAGAKIKEIPLVFLDRKYGETKLHIRDMVEYFVNAFRLRLRFQ